MKRSFACLLALLTVAATPLAGAADPLQDAQQLISDKHYQQALPALKNLVQADPANGRAWISLGDTYRGLGQVPDAASAYQRAYVLPATAMASARSLFLLYAGADDADGAFRWFGILRDAHGCDLSGLAEAPEVKALHGDTRFAILFPDKIAFRPPFVQDVKIIHEWDGEKAGDEFGWIARGAGDVDGDGVTDVVTSATGNPPYGDSKGRVYVYSGKSGKLLWKTEGKPGAVLGTGLEAAGDLDGDGIPDVVAGAPGEDAVYALSGKDGHALWRAAGDPKDHDLGTAVAGIGDFNRDGTPDVMAGAPSSEAHAKGSATGRAYVLSGKDGHVLLALDGEKTGDSFGSTVGGSQGRFIVGAATAGPAHHGRIYIYDSPDSKPRFTEDADATGAALGYMFVSVLGDVDKDGTPDIYAADFSDSAKGPASGRIYIYSGKTGRLLRTLTGEAPREGFGIGPGRVGDVDQDGYDDLIVGSWQYSGAAWSGGRVQVFSGKDGKLLQDIVGKVPGETLGFDAVGVGDVDGDGITDYLVTSAWSGINGLRSGRVYIVAGGIVPAHSAVL